MSSIRLLLLAALALPALSGCSLFSGKKKSSSRITAGDSSSITYTNPESAGGPIGGRR